MVIKMTKKLVYGVGVNDADYVVHPKIKGKQVRCPFYEKWKGMLTRCYSAKCQAANPTYIGCTVCEEWLKFSSFKSWMEAQDWQGKELDKDIITPGNKVYSPDTCAFVDEATNSFTTDCCASRGNFPIGVTFHRGRGKFQAYCNNQITKKSEYLGIFSCPEQAHSAWKRRKHEIACQLADLQTDKRVADALRVRYL